MAFSSTSYFSNKYGNSDRQYQRTALLSSLDHFDRLAEEVLQGPMDFSQHLEECGVHHDFNFVISENHPPAGVDLSDPKQKVAWSKIQTDSFPEIFSRIHPLLLCKLSLQLAIIYTLVLAYWRIILWLLRGIVFMIQLYRLRASFAIARILPYVGFHWHFAPHLHVLSHDFQRDDVYQLRQWRFIHS